MSINQFKTFLPQLFPSVFCSYNVLNYPITQDQSLPSLFDCYQPSHLTVTGLVQLIGPKFYI